MSINQVIKVCQQLKSEGKEPTTALIKARMPAPKSLPMIIAGLKHWKSNPNQEIDDNEESESEVPQKSLEERVAELEALVSKLTLRIVELETKS